MSHAYIVYFCLEKVPFVFFDITLRAIDMRHISQRFTKITNYAHRGSGYMLGPVNEGIPHNFEDFFGNDNDSVDTKNLI